MRCARVVPIPAAAVEAVATERRGLDCAADPSHDGATVYVALHGAAVVLLDHDPAPSTALPFDVDDDAIEMYLPLFP